MATVASNAQVYKLNVEAGALAPYTLDATVGVERHSDSGNVWELFGEAGDNWNRYDDGFWKGYFWDGGFRYKHRLVRYKNSNLRLRMGAFAGALERDFFFGVELGLEWAYVFRNGCELGIVQKNTVNFLHGDLFRDGLMLNLKIPL